MESQPNHGNDDRSDDAMAISEISERLASGEAISLQSACELYPASRKTIENLWGILVLSHSAKSTTLPSAEQSKSSEAYSHSPFQPIPEKFGEYQLIEQIGQGGMGVVYRAKQTSLGRTVAIKIIRPDKNNQKEVLRRFRKEAESIARLDHPNIVKIFQYGEFQSIPYLCMEFIEGKTLEEIAKNENDPYKIASLLVQVCSAIAEAHKNNVLHRDLKPSNILVESNGQAKVVDFGLAKTGPQNPLNVSKTETSFFPAEVSLGTQTGLVIGTPAYMAPEIATGRDWGGDKESGETRAGKEIENFRQSDVYSLGAVLYFCLTKRPPFEGETGLKTLMAVLEQEPPSPKSINPTVNRDLEMITMKCLQKPQELRYKTAESLSEDLNAFLNHQPIKARTGRFIDLFARTFGETHHAVVMENWGLLWMWHSVVLLLSCLVTTAMQWNGVDKHWQYLLFWSVGFGTWCLVFWVLRRRMGPVTFIERQIAHIWAGSLMATISLFFLEWYTDRGPLELAPMLGIVTSMVFLAKAGILSGSFYFQSFAMLLTTIPMALFPEYAHVIFGAVAGLSFFFPGLKYYRQRLKNQQK